MSRVPSFGSPESLCVPFETRYSYCIVFPTNRALWTRHASTISYHFVVFSWQGVAVITIIAISSHCGSEWASGRVVPDVPKRSLEEACVWKVTTSILTAFGVTSASHLCLESFTSRRRCGKNPSGCLSLLVRLIPNPLTLFQHYSKSRSTRKSPAEMDTFVQNQIDDEKLVLKHVVAPAQRHVEWYMINDCRVWSGWNEMVCSCRTVSGFARAAKATPTASHVAKRSKGKRPDLKVPAGGTPVAQADWAVITVISDNRWLSLVPMVTVSECIWKIQSCGGELLILPAATWENHICLIMFIWFLYLFWSVYFRVTILSNDLFLPGRVWHPECFRCSQCQQPIVGTFCRIEGALTCSKCRDAAAPKAAEPTEPKELPICRGCKKPVQEMGPWMIFLGLRLGGHGYTMFVVWTTLQI